MYCVDQLYSSKRRHSIAACELKIRTFRGRTLDKSLKQILVLMAHDTGQIRRWRLISVQSGRKHGTQWISGFEDRSNQRSSIKNNATCTLSVLELKVSM